MSNRYVWGRYSIQNSLSINYADPAIIPTVVTGFTDLYYSPSYSIAGNIITLLNPQVHSFNMNDEFTLETGGEPIYCIVGATSATAENVGYATSSSYFRCVYNYLDQNYKLYIYNSGSGICSLSRSQGTLQGYASSGNAGAYPTDGVSGSNWYEYQGSDTIDAASVSIPATIMGGTQIAITVTPGSGKVYEGNVSYEYQVKLGDGEWTTIATTTATSYNYTVPYGTTTFQVRVLASDNLGFTSTDYVSSSAVTVVNNQPPTAPGSINVANVVSGQTATITLTEATDPDGTIASYIYERSIDGQAWTQIANVNSLTQTDQVSADWGTVAYRACAVDDDGDSGPYVTSDTVVVNSGWLIISGPAPDMGDKPAPFNFEFSINATGATSTVTDINVSVTLDGENIYTGTPDAGETVSIPIDTRLMRAGEHNIQIAATKEDYLEVNGTFAFDIPAITLPDGGKAEQLQNTNGDVIFPYTLARLVIGAGGKDLNALMEQAMSTLTDLSGEVTEVKAGALKIATGSYTGTGTSGQNNPNSLTLEFVPVFIAVGREEDGMFPPENVTGNVDLTHKDSFIWITGILSQVFYQDVAAQQWKYRYYNLNGKTFTWYTDLGAILQANQQGKTYRYLAIGQ